MVFDTRADISPGAVFNAQLMTLGGLEIGDTFVPEGDARYTFLDDFKVFDIALYHE